MGPCNQTNMLNRTETFKNPNLQGGIPVGYLQSVADNLNKGNKYKLVGSQRGDSNLGPPDYKSVPLTT